AAGFFGVAMNYQGLDDPRSRPLCPVVIRPQHLVVEQLADERPATKYRTVRRAQATLAHGLGVSSKTLARGSIMSATLGLLAFLPLVLRSLFPRLAERLSHGFWHHLADRPKTQLALKRPEGTDGRGPVSGYSLAERTQIVFNLLSGIGLTESF